MTIESKNAVQEKLAGLKAKGWTLAAIADALGVAYNTVQKWDAGSRYPSTAMLVLQTLESLAASKRVPRKRRAKGHRIDADP